MYLPYLVEFFGSLIGIRGIGWIIAHKPIPGIILLLFSPLIDIFLLLLLILSVFTGGFTIFPVIAFSIIDIGLLSIALKEPGPTYRGFFSYPRYYRRYYRYR